MLQRSNYRGFSGFTLVEVLVAMAITLIIMGTIVTVFSQISTSVSDSRAGIEMSDQVQGVRDRLQRDLGGVTVATKPWQRLEAGAGYFEVIEGPRSDLVTTDAPETGIIMTTNASKLTLPAGTRVPATALGDFDDVLMFTSSDQESPYMGFGFQYEMGTNNIVEAMVESNDAEIIWYAIEHPVANQGEAGFRTIYRRALVVAPGMPIPPAANSLTQREFYEKYDVSVRWVVDKWVPNSLADLTWRENRFAHQSAPPYLVNLDRIHPYDSSQNSPLGPMGYFTDEFRRGQDIMLRNALAFDVRVYDPQAPLRLNGGIAVAPGEPGWASGSVPSDGAVGAFVDLNYLDAVAPIPVNLSDSWFAYRPRVFGSGMSLVSVIGGERYAYWDTWPFVYEQTIIPGFTTGLGTNGFDDDNNNVVDDSSEYSTSPPYMAPLRGILVRIRAYEPYSRQVRDVSMVENFSGK